MIKEPGRIKEMVLIRFARLSLSFFYNVEVKKVPTKISDPDVFFFFDDFLFLLQDTKNQKYIYSKKRSQTKDSTIFFLLCCNTWRRIVLPVSIQVLLIVCLTTFSASLRESLQTCDANSS